MKFIKTFENLTKNDVVIAGGKGASLGEMTQAGISVPPGFVLLADAFENFLEETKIDSEIKIILDKINTKNFVSIEQASQQIISLISDSKLPKDIAKEVEEEFVKLNTKYIAVRSSATAEDSLTTSWAGELETYLNTTKENLSRNINRCWSSLFTTRAIFYRFEKKLHNTKVSVAVVIQKMIAAEVSGIVFTVNPMTKNEKQMVIEAGWGLGELIVGGQITPDNYVVDKIKNTIINIDVSKQIKKLVNENGQTKETPVAKEEQDKQKLSNEQIIELTKICQKIENHFQKPQDIEWALKNNKFYILQSRPITTL